jgi:hypothetical protein
MKVLIIGAGWYGCHLAMRLLSLGLEVRIIDRLDQLFQAASRFNQNRLHYGMHYPRSAKTRMQSRRGFHMFMKEYAFLTEATKYNYYAVDNNESLMDFETYCGIMSYDKLPFQDVSDICPLNLSHINGVLDCEERIINPLAAKKYFNDHLLNVFEGGVNVSLDMLRSFSGSYDWVIDCTWGAFPELIDDEIFYESSVYFEYSSRLRSGVGLTLMDGRFFSIFPTTENGVSTVTSVKDVVAKVSCDMMEILQFNKSISSDFINILRGRTESLIEHYYPSFKDEYKYIRFIQSNKTKLKNQNDSRDVRIYQKGNVISVMSGKIDTIFDAEAIILNRIIR